MSLAFDESPMVIRQRLTQAILATPPGAFALLQAPRGFGVTQALTQAMAGTRARWLDASGLTEVGSLIGQVGSLADADWLVIDGVRQPALVSADLAELAGRIPQGCRVAVSATVPLSSLLLGQPWSTLLDRSALAFTEDEAMALLAHLAPSADPGEVASVSHVCEGWAAALVLAGGRLRRGGPGTEAWLRAAAPVALVGDWFEEQSAQTRRFLLDTAMLDVLSVGVSDAVREATDSGAVLPSFDAEEGPVYRVVDGPTGSATWRRHRLLTEFLRARTPSSPSHVDAHRRAAHWYIDHECVPEAMHHLLEAGEREAAGALLRDHEGDFISTGRVATTLDWYSRIRPTSHVDMGWQVTVEHQLRLGWARLLVGDLSGARDSLALVSRGVGPDVGSQVMDSPEAQALTGEAALLRAMVAAAEGDVSRMVAAAQHVTETFPDDLSENAAQLAPVVLARGLLWQGQVAAARSVIDGITALDYPNATLREVALRGVQAACAVAEGRVHEAAAIVAAGQSWLAERDQNALAVRQYTFVAAQAWTLAESGDLAAGGSLAEAVASAADGNAAMGDLVFARLAQVRALVLMGDVVGALAVIRSTRDDLRLSCPESALATPLGLAEADALLRAGDAPRAERIVRALPFSDQRTMLAARLTWPHQPARVARVMLRMRPTNPALTVHRRLQLAECYLASDLELTASHLTEAAQVAEENGMAMVLVDHPRLLDQARRLAGREPAGSLRWLLEVADDTRSGYQVRAGHAGPPVELSPGEIELLRWLPGRQTKADIAESLGISVNTVKTRMQRLYRKLGVRGRDEAIAEATRRGLLPR